MKSLLSGESLVRRYGDVTALGGVSLELARGEILALGGPSGSGKTTLLAMLGGLETPTEGRVMLDGYDLYALSHAVRARVRGDRVGFVFQTHNLLSTLTAEENVMLAIQHGPNPTGDPRARARESLALLGVTHEAGRLPRALSLGQQQRVAIARALAAGPPVIIADEPTASLDSQSGAAVLDALKLAAQRGCAVLLATHDPRCLAIASRVVTLRDGRCEAPPAV